MYYTLQRLDVPHTWRVVHKATNLIVTPLGICGCCKKADATKWLQRAERVAPTDDPEKAGKLLTADNYPRDWHDAIMKAAGF